MGARLELTVDVVAGVEQTWDHVVDWERQSAWMLGTRVRATSGGGVGVGAEIEAVTGVGMLGIRVGVKDTMRITRWEAPYRCAVVHTGRVVRGTGEFQVQARGEGRSAFIWSEDLDLPWGWLGRAGWLLVRPVFRAGVQLSLKRFARWVEAV